MQSALHETKLLHVAIIMDGNGRWATRRGLPRTAGHHAGVGAVRRIVEAAPDLGIAALTLFAFSSDNWRRPAEEVDALLGLLRTYLHAETQRLIEGGARLTVIGRRDRLPTGLSQAIGEAETKTAQGRRLDLRIAFDYSSREAIVRAAARWPAGQAPSADVFARLVAQAGVDASGPTEVDLLIRTGGEKRLSDFLLWECAYAELWFTDKAWPEFGRDDLAAAIAEFRGRERRFGGLKGAKPVTAVAGGRGGAR